MSKDVFAIKKDFYQFIGLYSSFQGVIITAVALSNALSCHISWAPGFLSLFASVLALTGVYSKLDYYHAQKNIVQDLRNDEAVSVIWLERADSVFARLFPYSLPIICSH